MRRFAPDPITHDVLLEILEIGRWTGSAKNTQPWEVIVVRERDTLTELARYAPYGDHLTGAQAAIVLVLPAASGGLDEGRLAQNLMLAAWAHGIGSCIASIFPEDNQESARALLGLPADRMARTALSLGYPADERARFLSKSADERGSTPMLPLGRRSLDELVSWERYGERSSANSARTGK